MRVGRYVVWFVATLFFAFQFVLRLFPSLVMEQTMVAYGIDAQQFGHYASLYYLGYSAMQIPAAYLLYRLLPSRVLSVAAFLCAVSAWICAYTELWQWLYFSRLLLGVGSAFAFLGVSEIITQLFDKDQYAKMVGITFTIGLFGAVYGGMPTANLLKVYDWQVVLSTLGLIQAVIAVLIAILVQVPSHAEASFSNFVGGLRYILSNPALMALAAANLLMVGALEGFADIWGVTYLMKAMEVTKPTAAAFTSLIFVGMIFGGPILAACSRLLNSELNVVMTCAFCLVMIFVMLLSQWWPLNAVMVQILMFVCGILCCYQVLVFSLGVRFMNRPELLGLTTAFLNCINMCGGVLYHNIIGQLLSWSHRVPNISVADYSLSDFTFALWSIPVGAMLGAMILSLVSLYFLKEKF
jgi:predicted MFS family arabinose efflux permease